MSVAVFDRCLELETFNEYHSAAFRKCRIKGRPIVERLIEGSHARHVLFKPICDSHRLDELLEWWQPSRAIWLYRDYRAVARSAVKRWGKFNQLHLNHLQAGGGDWGWSQWNREAYSAELLAEVFPLLNDRLTPHGAAAIYWYLQNRRYSMDGLSERGDVLLCRYDELIANPAREFEAICEFLGIEFREEMVRGVRRNTPRNPRELRLEPEIEQLCESLLGQLDSHLKDSAARALGSAMRPDAREVRS